MSGHVGGQGLRQGPRGGAESLGPNHSRDPGGDVDDARTSLDTDPVRFDREAESERTAHE